ncbi:MAG: hypothetical protein K8R88_05990 [Armatimonadetes bacterium]|nr:hypothetical protein [Armatimonadota bacterium]
MKGMFPEYDSPTEAQYKECWEKAIFVFDTNILLNFYRYGDLTRKDLLGVMQKLKTRIWIPHHVAAEFQRNRRGVIAKRIQALGDIETVLGKLETGPGAEIEKLRTADRHSVIDVAKVQGALREAILPFKQEAARLKQGHLALLSDDFIKNEIEELFHGKVGPGPENQEAIEALNKKAQERYNNLIPPGFEDDDKDKDGPDAYLLHGLRYKRKYGDFFLWIQTLTHCNSKDHEHLILISDDRKPDWWQKLEAQGPKIQGPRPELISEAGREYGVRSFLMYDTSGFLEYSKKYLDAKVSQDTFDEVSDLSAFFSPAGKLAWNTHQLAAAEWLHRRFADVHWEVEGFDFVAAGEVRVGVEVESVWKAEGFPHRISLIIDKLLGADESLDLAGVLIFVFTGSREIADYVDKVIVEKSKHFGSFQLQFLLCSLDSQGELVVNKEIRIGPSLFTTSR